MFYRTIDAKLRQLGHLSGLNLGWTNSHVQYPCHELYHLATNQLYVYRLGERYASPLAGMYATLQAAFSEAFDNIRASTKKDLTIRSLPPQNSLSLIQTAGSVTVASAISLRIMQTTGESPLTRFMRTTALVVNFGPRRLWHSFSSRGPSGARPALWSAFEMLFRKSGHQLLVTGKWRSSSTGMSAHLVHM